MMSRSLRVNHGRKKWGKDMLNVCVDFINEYIYNISVRRIAI